MNEIRACALYRVSSKQQVGPHNDLPMQEIACREFVESKGWRLTHEYYERGISGFKKTSAKRDVIQEIKQDALAKQFDVLVVFMFDRLGRREDDTPPLMRWFVEHGISMWSVREGEQRFDSHVDKLTSYLRFWQAEGESEKTSMRVSERQEQLVRDGQWRGGAHPFGYQLVHNGRMGKKNRLLYDLAIDEAEAAIVRLIFKLTIEDGWGRSRIANHLNDAGAADKLWVPASIASIQKNITYTGRMRLNDYVAPPDENLRIISDESYEQCQRVTAARSTRRGADGSKSAAYAPRLLRGILYCGSCQKRLVASYVRESRNGVERVRPIYRCYTNATKAKHCTGQSTYSAHMLEEAVLGDVRLYLAVMGNIAEKDVRINHAQRVKQDIENVKREMSELERKRSLLQDEVVKTLTGESTFDAKTLKEILHKNDVAIAAVRERLETLNEHGVEEAAKQMQGMRRIASARDLFDKANDDVKRNILATIIDRIEVNTGSNDGLIINIHYRISAEEFIDPDSMGMFIDTLGSARHSHCRGQEFESPMLHHKRTSISIRD